MKAPKVCILRTAGTNCDKETGFAFVKAGAEIEFVHINKLISRKEELSSYHILAIPGGFSYGDDISAGKIMANELRNKLSGGLKKFIADGKLIIGICNGFQILVKSGLLPGNPELKQEASLIINDSGKFEDRWVYLRAPSHQVTSHQCVWARDLPEVIYLPVAHGEGKFVTGSKKVLEEIKARGQIVFQYCNKSGGVPIYPDNPNGSEENIAGICDQTGRILGLMPHPERHAQFFHHPRWTALKERKEGDGMNIFRNGVEYARRNLC